MMENRKRNVHLHVKMCIRDRSEDQAAIFDGWSACLNYFDSSLPFQLSLIHI